MSESADTKKQQLHYLGKLRQRGNTHGVSWVHDFHERQKKEMDEEYQGTRGQAYAKKIPDGMLQNPRFCFIYRVHVVTCLAAAREQDSRHVVRM